MTPAPAVEEQLFDVAATDGEGVRLLTPTVPPVDDAPTDQLPVVLLPAGPEDRDEREGVRLLPAAAHVGAVEGGGRATAWWLPGAEEADDEPAVAVAALPSPAVAAAGPVEPVAAAGAGGARRAVGAALLAVAAVVVGIAVLGAWHGVDRTSPAAGRTAASSGTASAVPVAPPVVSAPPVVPPPVAAPVRPSITVFNNSQVHDLGTRMAARFAAGGWAVTKVGSLSGRIRASTVYYAAGQQEQATALAAQFGIARVLPRLPALPGSGLAVVVTRDLA